MVKINLRELRENLQLLGLAATAEYYKVDLFDLNNLIFSHKGRNGTYPVDGKRDRALVKPLYTYPTKRALIYMLKKESAFKVSVKLGVSYFGLLRYIKKEGIKIN